MTDDEGWTALHFSTQNGSYELIKFFIDKATDIHLKTKTGVNCLHIAARNGNLDLCKTFIKKHKFDVNVSTNDGWKALHFAAKNGSYELVKFFADKGIGIHLQTKHGSNCLHIAARNGHLNLCKILTNKHCFDVHMTNSFGWTALHTAAQSGNYELLKLFIDKGADIHLKTKNGDNCLHIAAYIGHLNLCKILSSEHNFDVDMTDDEGWTALHFSAKNGNFELFLYFLEKGSDIYCKTKGMGNVLHFSALNGHFDICEFILKYFTKDYEDNNTRNQHALNGIRYKSQVFYKYNTIFLHAMDVDGNTYLHLAAHGNHSKVCKLLLKYDTEFITLLNKKDETVKDTAKKNDYKDVLNALKGHFDRIGRLSYLLLLLLLFIYVLKRCIT